VKSRKKVGDWASVVAKGPSPRGGISQTGGKKQCTTKRKPKKKTLPHLEKKPKDRSGETMVSSG